MQVLGWFLVRFMTLKLLFCSKCHFIGTNENQDFLTDADCLCGCYMFFRYLADNVDLAYLHSSCAGCFIGIFVASLLDFVAFMEEVQFIASTKQS